MYAFKVTFKSLIAKERQNEKKSPNLVVLILEIPYSVAQIRLQWVKVMYQVYTVIIPISSIIY